MEIDNERRAKALHDYDPGGSDGAVPSLMISHPFSFHCYPTFFSSAFVSHSSGVASFDGRPKSDSLARQLLCFVSVDGTPKSDAMAEQRASSLFVSLSCWMTMFLLQLRQTEPPSRLPGS